MIKHTPTPWVYDCGNDGAVIYKTDIGTIANVPCDLIASEANAAFIVRAVNNHDGLVAALEKFIIADEDSESESDFFNKMTAAILEAKKVLAEAKN